MILKAAQIIVTGFRIICLSDLTPLDLSVSGYLKNEVYKRQMNNLNEIYNCCRDNEQMLQNIFKNKKKSVRRCLEQNRGYLEAFL
jgi:hypothetical protein